MWNDTVRKQSESSFITGDINSSASLNRGNYKLWFCFVLVFFVSLTLVMAVMSLKYIAPFFLTSDGARPYSFTQEMLTGRRFCAGCFLFSFLHLILYMHFQGMSFLEGN